MNSNEVTQFIELLAVLVLFVGPILTYFIAKRKLGPDLLLADINAVRGWSEQRQSMEAEIAGLHADLIAEQDKRREERAAYMKSMDEIRAELRELKDALRDCLGSDLD